MVLVLSEMGLTRKLDTQRHALTPVEDDLAAYAVRSRQQVADSGTPLRQSCSFVMHRAQQDPVIDGRTKPDWENNDYSTELWLARRWATYPQAPSASSSDFAFVAFNQSLLCSMKKLFTIQREWAQQVVPFAESLGNNTPVVLVNLLENCPPPRRRPSNVRLLREVRRSPRWLMVSPTSPHVSRSLPTSPHVSSHLPTSPHVSLRLPTSPHLDASASTCSVLAR